MANPTAQKFVDSVANMVAEKEAFEKKQKQALRELDKAVRRLGYRIVSLDGQAPLRKPRRRRRTTKSGEASAKRPGRPPKTGKK